MRVVVTLRFPETDFSDREITGSSQGFEIRMQLRDRLSSFSPVFSLVATFSTSQINSVRVLEDEKSKKSNSRVYWPELRNYRLKVEIFQLGAKFASPKTPQTRRPEEHGVYSNHTRLNLDFARKNLIAFDKASIFSRRER
ncbi:hypothetical protein EYF80_028810 [Liparis tanakae]|uniref:Uncharacterized protein n=1 Tax=Liparis tanakae TaxID=230148 RepID=A0A4Z2H8E6_9TELE|nr:hypothetical protein EYF80_028810 [Liparis tanakae]